MLGSHLLEEREAWTGLTLEMTAPFRNSGCVWQDCCKTAAGLLRDCSGVARV